MPKDIFLKFKNNVANKRAEIFIYGDIGEWSDVSAKDLADKLSEVKGRDLDVYINSGGGSVFTASAILSQFKRHTGVITVHIDGMAASAASFLAMAGDKIIMPANAMMYIHNPLTHSVGYASDMRKTADDLDRIREAIVSAYQEKTLLDRDKITEIMDDETWLGAEEAVELGFADEVGEAREYAASLNGTRMVLNGANFDLSKFKIVPTQFLQSAGTPAKTIEPTAEEETEAMDLEKLKNEHPELYKQVLEEGFNNGVQEERERLKDIDALNVKGFDDVVAKAKYTDPLNAGSLAVAVLKAENKIAADHQNNVADDAEQLGGLTQEDPKNEDEEQQEKEQGAVNAIVAGITAALGGKIKSK